MSSSNTQESKYLATSDHLKRFLQEFANLRNEPESVKRFLNKFKQMIPPVRPKAWPERKSWTEEQTLEVWVFEIQAWMREGWREPDWRVRAHIVFWLLMYVAPNPSSKLRPRGSIRPDQPPTLFERSLFDHLLRDFSLAKYCANRECPAPYFFAQKVRQKYCSEVCSQPAQRAAKLKYWNSTGKKKRKKKPLKKGLGKHGKKRRSL